MSGARSASNAAHSSSSIGAGAGGGGGDGDSTGIVADACSDWSAVEPGSSRSDGSVPFPAGLQIDSSDIWADDGAGDSRRFFIFFLPSGPST